MAVKLVAATSLKVGGFMLMEGVPSRIVNIDTSRPGKHGHAKCRIEAIGMIDNLKRIKIFPGHDKVEVPIIEKKGAQVLSVKEDMASVMDLETYETFDLKISEELQGQVKEGIQVVYWIIMNEKILKQIK